MKTDSFSKYEQLILVFRISNSFICLPIYILTETFSRKYINSLQVFLARQFIEFWIPECLLRTKKLPSYFQN